MVSAVEVSESAELVEEHYVVGRNWKIVRGILEYSIVFVNGDGSGVLLRFARSTLRRIIETPAVVVFRCTGRARSVLAQCFLKNNFIAQVADIFDIRLTPTAKASTIPHHSITTVNRRHVLHVSVKLKQQMILQ